LSPRTHDSCTNAISANSLGFSPNRRSFDFPLRALVIRFRLPEPAQQGTAGFLSAALAAAELAMETPQ
jgi:hypothetical protein